MTLRVTELSSALNNTIRNIDFSSIEKSAKEAIDNYNAAKKSILGGIAGEIKSGIEVLNNEIDDAKEKLSGAIAPVITRLTPKIDGSDKLTGKVPAGQISTDIELITGKAAAKANGFLQEIISHGSPEAINKVLKTIANINPEEIKNMLGSIVTSELSGLVTKAVVNSPFGKLLNSVSIFNHQLNNLLGANSNILMIDFGEKISKNFENVLTNLIGNTIGKTELSSAFNLVTSGNYEDAFNQVSKYVPLPENYYTITSLLPRTEWPADIIEAYDRMNTISAEFKTLETGLSSYVNQYDNSASGAGHNTLPVNNINSGPLSSTTTYSGKTTDGVIYDFSDIKSAEELESLFRNINRPEGREIAGAIIHWSATFLDQNWGSAEIHQSHIERGFSGCGYHIIIRRDGTLQRGRPMNLEGAHDEHNNETFLGFCFIGGINLTSSAYASKGKGRETWEFAGSESFTSAQYNTYDQLMRSFHSTFPYAQVAGHYMTSTRGKIDPGFDVVAYSESKFNHKNVIPENDPIWKADSVITIDTIKQYAGTGSS